MKPIKNTYLILLGISLVIASPAVPVLAQEAWKRVENEINQEKCIHCGTCYKECPISVVTETEF